MQETCVQSLGREDALEKEMTIHFSILAWEIPRTEPDKLQPMGLQESDATERLTHTHTGHFCFRLQVDQVWPQDVSWVQVWSIFSHLPGNKGFPGGLGGKVFACSAGDLALIPGSERSPGEGNGNLLQYSCLENSMDRGTWQAIVHGVTRVGHDLMTKPPPGNRSHSGCVLMVNARSSWEGQKHPTPCLLRTLTLNWCAINSTRVCFTRTNGKAKSNISGAEKYNPFYHSVGKNELSNRIRMGCSKFPKLHPSTIIQNCPVFTWTCMKSPC